ncbi:hypothetical protein ALMP_57650 [Streptomyces sp. A012304]|nr:hypothetical protein ALMP_57650 [Streptomyces sp. A012304]
MRGRIKVRRRITDDGRFRLEPTVPPTATATVTVPDGSMFQAAPGERFHTCGVGSRP